MLLAGSSSFCIVWQANLQYIPELYGMPLTLNIWALKDMPLILHSLLCAIASQIPQVSGLVTFKA